MTITMMMGIGTYVYYSPERLAGATESSKIDIFAAGLVCAEKMHNTRIDSYATREKLIERVNKGEISGLATSELVNLVSSMLEVNSEKRPSAEVFLEHPFVQGFADQVTETMDESDE
jgi:serine/threonine protein kinase